MRKSTWEPYRVPFVVYALYFEGDILSKYIGVTVKPWQVRLSNHLSLLRRQKHHAKLLQAKCNQIGIEFLRIALLHKNEALPKEIKKFENIAIKEEIERGTVILNDRQYSEYGSNIFYSRHKQRQRQKAINHAANMRKAKARKKAEASPPSYRSLPCDIDSNWIEVIVITCTHGHRTERKYLLDRGTKQGYQNQGVLWDHTEKENPVNMGIMGKSKAMIEIGKGIPFIGFHGS